MGDRLEQQDTELRRQFKTAAAEARENLKSAKEQLLAFQNDVVRHVQNLMDAAKITPPRTEEECASFVTEINEGLEVAGADLQVGNEIVSKLGLGHPGIVGFLKTGGKRDFFAHDVRVICSQITDRVIARAEDFSDMSLDDLVQVFSARIPEEARARLETILKEAQKTRPDDPPSFIEKVNAIIDRNGLRIYVDGQPARLRYNVRTSAMQLALKHTTRGFPVADISLGLDAERPSQLPDPDPPEPNN